MPEDISEEDNERLEKLFEELDVNKDGRIDIDDLTEALSPDHAERFISYSDMNRDGHLDFREFTKFVLEHEKQLKLVFTRLDVNQDGVIDKEEITKCFKNLGVNIDPKEAERLIKKIDKDKTLKIDWNEWREYMMFHPGSNIYDILHYWRHDTIIDIGEGTLVPDDFTEEELTSGMWWRHLLAGGAAGAVSRTCTAPLDRLKVLLQVHGASKNITIKSGFQHMLKEGGVKSLWRGNGINVIKIAPETAIKFMAYEQLKRFVRGGEDREIKLWERFACGSSAGLISQTSIYPMEVLKTRLALRKTGQYSGIWDCARKVYVNEGIKSFYRGYVPNMLGIIPYAGIDLAIYETLKARFIKSHPNNEDPSILVLLLCGTLSSSCGQLASYPLALIRTKLQSQAHLRKPGNRDSMLGLGRHILKHEGFRGLYRGIIPNFMKVAPAVSISYVVYEHIRKALGIKMS